MLPPATVVSAWLSDSVLPVVSGAVRNRWEFGFKVALALEIVLANDFTPEILEIARLPLAQICCSCGSGRDRQF